MKVSRILVLQENVSGSRDLRFNVLDHAVEFEFRPPELVTSRKVDAGAFAAVAAPIDCARPDLLDTLGRSGSNGAPVFLYRGDPPLHEVARWVILGKPSPAGAEGTVSDRLLIESLEYYSMASLYQQCLRMMSSQDEEKLVSQITDTFTGELGAESCVVWLASPSDPDEMMIASVRGLIGIDREGSRFLLSQSEVAEAVWKGAPFIVSTVGKSEKGAARHGSLLYVPLLHQEKPIGIVKLGDRHDRRSYGDRELHLARIIAGYAAAALNTVDRLGRMEKISIRDPETGAYSAAFHEDYFEKERFKAGRFHRPLSVIFLVVENLSFLMEQTRESIVVGALSAMVESVRKTIRESDLVSRQEANRFCIVLPETDAFGALLAVRRLRKAVREKSRIQFLGAEYSLQTLFMSATCPRDGRDFPGLLRVAEEKYARQQKSPLHRQRLADRSFWDAFEILVGKAEYYEILRRGEDVPYFLRFRRDLGRQGHFSVPRETYLRILEAVAQDMAATPEDRGIVIVAGPTPEIYKQIFLSFEPARSPRMIIYIVGQSGATRFDARNLLYASTEDEMLLNREVLLYLRESGAYALFGTDRAGEIEGFNTADEWLVEAMMEKIQDMYHLQGNF
jgi:diguanylate cyclase (GGDEF)-like protein